MAGCASGFRSGDVGAIRDAAGELVESEEFVDVRYSLAVGRIRARDRIKLDGRRCRQRHADAGSSLVGSNGLRN